MLHPVLDSPLCSRRLDRYSLSFDFLRILGFYIRLLWLRLFDQLFFFCFSFRFFTCGYYCIGFFADCFDFASSFIYYFGSGFFDCFNNFFSSFLDFIYFFHDSLFGFFIDLLDCFLSLLNRFISCFLEFR